MGKKPNIVFIVTDQHNAKVMGNAGDPYVRTPNLDRLAENGVKFDNCYCAAPGCVPSRGAFITGKLPNDNGSHSNACYVSSNQPTVAHSLTIAGYETVLSGRMHFSGADQLHGFEKRLVGDINSFYKGDKREAE